MTDVELDYSENDDELMHEGVLRKSGRYPWGSGETPTQRNRSFLDHVESLRRQGLTEVEIAKGFGVYNENGRGISTTALRAAKSIAKNENKAADITRVNQLRADGDSNVAIGIKMGINESQVRALSAPGTKIKNDELQATANMLKAELKDKGLLDVGIGTEHHMGVSDTKLRIAVAMLNEEGYGVYKVKSPQLGTDQLTNYKVLAPPGVSFGEVAKNMDKVRNVTGYSKDLGRTYTGPQFETPTNVNSKRIEIKLGDDGGADSDGVIQLRRGVEDISLGASRYAQVRIAVDGTHYLKGMAVYADDLPDGIDMRFNTNKNKAELQKAVADGKAPNTKLAAMKEIKKDKATGLNDPDSPFGSIVRQNKYTDSKGKEQLSALNLVNEEGQWDKWSSKLSSQFLSKQSPAFAKEQLGVRFAAKKKEFDEIMLLTNPTVRKKLLETFSDDADSSSVHLKAAGLPRTKSKVILPINSLKDTEIYAPTFDDGELVVLVRHPHGGIFEIPELRVNNRNREAKRIMQNAVDAVGINSRVAERLSGADFDGDTVLVIPNNSQKIKTSPQLVGLKNFNPRTAYPEYEGMSKMSPRTKQLKMGDISNLITDMTIRGAGQSDTAAAVRHSMVVIDAEKHNLNWKQSAKDNNISALKTRYQGSARSGASTLISKSSSEITIPQRVVRNAAGGGYADITTGKRAYQNTDASYIAKEKLVTYANGKTKLVPEHVVVKTSKVAKMFYTDDANTLSSGTPMEQVYADYANRLKALANMGRKEALSTKSIPYSSSAKLVYDTQVKSLNAKLNIAKKNAPLERQAQLVGNAIVRAKRDANPDMDDADLKKVKGQAITTARERVGASKTRIKITDPEWQAIQAGAISKSKLEDILNNTDVDVVKKLATPRINLVMDVGTAARARTMLSSGYTQAEVARALGIAPGTLSSSLKDAEGGTS